MQVYSEEVKGDEWISKKIAFHQKVVFYCEIVMYVAINNFVKNAFILFYHVATEKTYKLQHHPKKCKKSNIAT